MSSNPPGVVPASSPPGRSGLPGLGETLAFLEGSGPFVAERTRRYGPIFRTHLFGKPTIALIGAEANRFILSEGMDHFCWKDGWPPTFPPLLGKALFLQDGDEHRQKRRLLMPAFRSEALASYLTTMDERLQVSLQRWERLGRFAWHDEFTRLTIEVASMIFLGGDLGPPSDEFIQLMATWTAGLIGLPIRLPFTPFGRALKAREILLDHVDRAVRRRIEKPTRDALGLLVAARDEEGRGLDLDELKSQALFLVAAGYATTASMMASTARALAEHPDVLARAREEQRALDDGGPLTLEKLRLMTWLEQILREVERLYPPVGFGFRGVIAPFEFGGYTIAKGMQVLYSIEATHTDPENYADPERFDPARFGGEARAAPDQRVSLVIDPRGEPEQRNSFKLVGFGGGPRICIGMAVAKTQLKIVFSRLLRGYDWELEPGQDLRVTMMPARRYRSGLLVRFRRRAP